MLLLYKSRTDRFVEFFSKHEVVERVNKEKDTITKFIYRYTNSIWGFIETILINDYKDDQNSRLTAISFSFHIILYMYLVGKENILTISQTYICRQNYWPSVLDICTNKVLKVLVWSKCNLYFRPLF